MTSETRSIFMHDRLGRRQFKEVLGSLLAGLIIRPEPLWLVSPWISDFDLLDNRSGEWSVLRPHWELRVIRFSEVLAACVEAGCELKVVTRDEKRTRAFLHRLAEHIGSTGKFQKGTAEELHVKGLISNSWYLSGSMNFTFSGAHRNHEQILLHRNPDLIVDTRLEFEHCYSLELS